jgi:hypothetical protein
VYLEDSLRFFHTRYNQTYISFSPTEKPQCPVG